jgi:hypothetical protein
MQTPQTPHFLRFARALALAGALGSTSVGCGAVVSPTDGAVPDAPLACVCCPTGDWSGRCSTSPMGGDMMGAPRMPIDGGSGEAPPPQQDGGGTGIAPPPPQQDAGPTFLDPPPGQRWCTSMDLIPARPGGPSCPVAGPLPPPEMSDSGR